MKKFVTSARCFKKRYADVFKGDERWRKIKTVKGETYAGTSSTYAEPALLRRHDE
jgi:aconitate hydratase